MFTQEHINVRKKYNTSQQAQHWLDTLNTTKLNSAMIKMIENMNYFFFATSSKDGDVNVNFKGGSRQKLLKVLDPNTIIFPDFEGNGILHSIGDLQTNPNVGLLIIDFSKDKRIKINGQATIIDNKKEIVKYLDIFDSFEFNRVIKVKINYVIPNCSNNLHIVRDEILEYTKNWKALCGW